MKDSQTKWEDTVEWVGVVAGCIIRQDDKYLLVQEKQPKAYGLWNVPAGYVDKGESIEQAAIREVKEESGYDVALGGRVGVYHESVEKPVKHAFEARIVGGDLNIQLDEILDAAWLTLDEIKALNEENKIRAPWVWDAINRVESGEALGL